MKTLLILIISMAAMEVSTENAYSFSWGQGNDRFQIIRIIQTKSSISASDSPAYLIDTQTGRIWIHDDYYEDFYEIFVENLNLDNAEKVRRAREAKKALNKPKENKLDAFLRKYEERMLKYEEHLLIKKLGLKE